MENKNYEKAFPRENTTNQYGMTLRDYFAAKAMQGVISNTLIDYDSRQDMAKNCYEIADAMMEEREER